MIAIVNITDNPQPTGEHTYVLKINNSLLLQFRHNREDSLSTCLRKAAEAYDNEYCDNRRFGVELDILVRALGKSL